MRSKQRDQAPPTDIDLDAIGSDVDAAEECDQHGSSLVWREPPESFRDLAATLDQAVLSSSISVFIADRVEDCSLIGKEGSKPDEPR